MDGARIPITASPCNSDSMKWPPWRETTFDEAWDECARPWTQVRNLSDHDLIERLTGDKLDPTYKLALEAEQRRREAWRSPAGKAIWISLVALVVSIIALIRSFVGYSRQSRLPHGRSAR